MIKFLSKFFKKKSFEDLKYNKVMSYAELEKLIIDIEQEYQEMIINSGNKEEIKKLNEQKDLDIIAVKQLWNESAVNGVSYYLKIMGYDISEDGKDIAVKLMVSGYNEVESSSYISMVSMALDVKNSSDIIIITKIYSHAMDLLKLLKKYKDSGFLRENIWKNDSVAIFNISNPSEHVKEWVNKILSDEMIKGKSLAKSRIDYKN